MKVKRCCRPPEMADDACSSECSPCESCGVCGKCGHAHAVVTRDSFVLGDGTVYRFQPDPPTKKAEGHVFRQMGSVGNVVERRTKWVCDVCGLHAESERGCFEFGLTECGESLVTLD